MEGARLDEIVVVNGKRTPFGRFGGSLREISSVELGGLAIRKVMENLPVGEKEIDGVIMGLCLPGVGLSPARQAVLAAKLPVGTNAFTVDRACCSALSAVGIGMQFILRDQASILIAGGMENMSRTPYLVPQMRWGARLGDFTIRDELVIRMQGRWQLKRVLIVKSRMSGPCEATTGGVWPRRKANSMKS
jgi:acetyl-CoA C-acetyltransferase